MAQAALGAGRPLRIRAGRRHRRDVFVPQMELEYRAAGGEHAVPEDPRLVEAGESEAQEAGRVVDELDHADRPAHNAVESLDQAPHDHVRLTRKMPMTIAAVPAHCRPAIGSWNKAAAATTCTPMTVRPVVRGKA